MTGVDGAFDITVPSAIDPAAAAAFARDFERGLSDPAARVIVLKGGDGVFCRGMQPSSPDASELRHYLNDFAECLLRMRFSSKPVVAVVDGIAIGGGLGLAATADMVIASDRSTFGLPEALFGFVPAVILPLLLERMRPKDCRLWLLTGYSRTATEALGAGMVDLVCSVEGLQQETSRAIRRLSRVGTDAVRDVKRMTAHSELEPLVRKGVEATTKMLMNPEVSGPFLKFFEDGSLPWRSS